MQPEVELLFASLQRKMQADGELRDAVHGLARLLLASASENSSATTNQITTRLTIENDSPVTVVSSNLPAVVNNDLPLTNSFAPNNTATVGSTGNSTSERASSAQPNNQPSNQPNTSTATIASKKPILIASPVTPRNSEGSNYRPSESSSFRDSTARTPVSIPVAAPLPASAPVRGNNGGYGSANSGYNDTGRGGYNDTGRSSYGDSNDDTEANRVDWKSVDPGIDPNQLADLLIERADVLNTWLATGQLPESEPLFARLTYSSYRLRHLETGYRALGEGLRASHYDKRGFEIAALAQNIVLQLIEALGQNDFDPQQRLAFNYLRYQAALQSYFLYGLSANHRVELGQSSGLLKEAQGIVAKHQAQHNTSKAREDLLKKIRFHTRKLMNGEVAEWPKILPLLEGLLAEDALEVTKPELGQLRNRNDVPAALQERFAAIIEACWPSDDSNETTRERHPLAIAVGQALAGRSILLIGGEPRPEALERLNHDFAPARVVWQGMDHFASSRFEAAIADPNVAVVCRIISLISHETINLRETCAKHGKGFVSLPKGYGSAQVAKAVQEQFLENSRTMVRENGSNSALAAD
jgi:hypothetical protein